METPQALKIIRALADGINPITDEMLRENCPYQTPQIIRALFAAPSSLERSVEREQRKHGLPTNAGKPWDAEEDSKLCADFDNGMTIGQLAQRYQRTNGSIQSRLVKLGKIEPIASSR